MNFLNTTVPNDGAEHLQDTRGFLECDYEYKQHK